MPLISPAGPKHQRTSQVTCATWNASLAGSTSTKARNASYQFLQAKPVRETITARQAEMARAFKVGQDTVIGTLARRAFFDPAEFAVMDSQKPSDIMRLGVHERACIDGWKWDGFGNFVLIFADWTKALDMLARHLAPYKDKLEVEVVDRISERIARAWAKGKTGALAHIIQSFKAS
jgi:hypothetical protein